MRLSQLGRFTVARVGYGAMQLAGPGVFGPPADRDEALAVLRAAVGAGVNHIDTAEYYGPTVVNELIREALHPYPNDLVIVSKVGARRDQTGAVLRYDEPDELRRGIEDNLRTLQLDQLAAVNLRIMDSTTPRPTTSLDSTTPRSLDSDGPDSTFDAQLASMVRARDEGLIAGIGLSNISLDQLRRALASTDIVCVQNSFSLVDRSSTPVLRECVQRGIAFVPFLPLGWPRESRSTILENPTVVRIAQRYDATPTQIALAWLTGLAESILLIPGTSSLKHLRENIAVDSIALDEDAMAQLDTAFP